MMAAKKVKSLSVLTAVLILLAAVFFVIQFFVADKYIVTQPEYYSAPHLLFTLSRFYLVLIAAALALVSVLLKQRKLSIIAVVLSLVAALAQFFAIKITDVFPYFITYEFGTIWPLYLGGVLLIGGAALKLFTVED